MPLLKETKDELELMEPMERLERLEEIVDSIVENMMVIMKNANEAAKPKGVII